MTGGYVCLQRKERYRTNLESVIPFRLLNAHLLRYQFNIHYRCKCHHHQLLGLNQGLSVMMVISYFNDSEKRCINSASFIHAKMCCTETIVSHLGLLAWPYSLLLSHLPLSLVLISILLISLVLTALDI